ncbi:MAG: type IV secretory system conjugative DNA transfer family protein [Acetobacteraceae bacterium]|nr:type IV secretory system conjugative DNA transfer family protein [Acetobacteraceae bacterium]
MKDSLDHAPRTRKRLLGTTALLAGVLGLSSAATQFVAWRVHYHPALGTPWFRHIYAPWSWVPWMQAPWAPNAKATFGLVDAGLMGAVSVAMVAGLMVSSGRRRKPVKHEGVHGTARFMSELEIRQSGLLSVPGQRSAGVYVGGWTDPKGRVHYLRHDGPEHCIVIAPTRSGKGVGNILPTLLSWPASTLIYDEKGELWQLTAGWRARHADNVVIRWEPGAVEGSAGFNFLEEVRLGTPYEVADAQNIAQMICDPNGDGIEGKDHWGKTSFDLLAAVILHVMYKARKKGKVGSLADVAYALSDPEEKSDVLWEEMRTNRHLPTGTHPVVAAAGRDQLDRPEKERGSVLSSAKTYLTLVKDPIIAANTKRSDFRIMDLMNHDRPVSLYVVTRGGDKERLRPLIRLLLTMAMRQLMGVELKYHEGQPLQPHKHRLLMMLDEFPSLGKLQIIQDALPKCAGYGIKAFLAAQNREQMFGAYGQHQSITANCHIRIVYAPNEWESAEWISRMVGNTTIVKEDVTESGTRLGSLKHVSRTYHEVSRPLLTPDEVMDLKKPRRDEDGRIVESGEMVVFMAGERPIFGTPILYFLDPTFERRARIEPPASGATRARPKVFQAA